MSNYKYVAVSKQGERLQAEESAASESELARNLRQRGYVLVEVQELTAKKPEQRVADFFSGLLGVSLEEKLMFMRNLKVMVVSGIALPKTLDVLSSQARSARFKAALRDMRKKVVEGQQLSDAMEDYPSLFSELFRNMIRTGEESGTLEEVLTQLTLQLEREHEVKSKVQGALIYPAVILVAMVGIGVLMLILVVPSLAETFEELQVPLPVTTQIIIAFADILTRFWYLVIVALALLVIGLYRAVKTAAGKRIIDTILLRLPVVGPIVKKMNTAFFARTMSSLVEAGIPMVRSLEVSATVVQNTHFQKVLKDGAVEMRKGVKLSEILEKHTTLYPLVVVQMLQVGEETGKTAELLAKLADFFEEEISNITKNLASIIEPALMLVIGAVVGFFAVSMLQPMYSMLGSF